MTSVAENAKCVPVNGIGKDSFQIQREAATVHNKLFRTASKG
jgi:hypothetical protein